MIGSLRSDLEIENSGDFLYAGEPDLIAAFDTLNPAHFNSALQGNYAFDPCSFVDRQLGTIGDSARTTCCGPPKQRETWLAAAVTVSQSSTICERNLLIANLRPSSRRQQAGI
jgi:hypothetical protein